MKTTINPIVRVKAAHIGAAVVCALSFGASASPSPVINSVDIASLVTQQSNDVNAMLSLSGNQSVHAVNTVDIDKTGVSITKFQQKVHGIPVFGSTFTAHQSAMGVYSQLRGQLVTGLEQQKNLRFSRISSDEAFDIALASDRYGVSKADVRNIQKEEMIYPLNGRYVRSWVVSYFTEGSKEGSTEGTDEREPVRIESIIDAQSGKILNRANILTHALATGPGGNLKTGFYEYGIDYGPLKVPQTGDICAMTNGAFDVNHMNHQMSGMGTLVEFTCPTHGTAVEGQPIINGAYNPINDAYFFASAVQDMYGDYVGEAPVAQKYTIRVHYGNNYENAYWDGASMAFGDGGSRFHPLVGIDVLAHELSHAFTERHAGFTHAGMAGALNESFSDMAGEAAKYYLYGSNDWMVGASISKAADSAARYMDDPAKDGDSIDHMDQYASQTNPYFASGIFNKAFYLLATSPGWDVAKAFETMGLANRLYWTANSTFDQAACGVNYAAMDLGYDQWTVADAFDQVGVNSCIILPPPPPELYQGVEEVISGDASSERHFYYHTPMDVTDVSFKMQGGSGDGDIYVKFGSQPTLTNYDCRPYTTGNNESCDFANGQMGTYYVMVRGYTAFSDASVIADHNIIAQPDSGSVSDITISAGQWQYYTVDVPAGMSTLTINISGGTGDADLYARVDSQPTFSTYDCRPFDNGNNETCTLLNPQAGVWHIGLRAYVDTAGLTMDWVYQ